MHSCLCHLKILETLQFPRALGSCKGGICKHKLPSRDPSAKAKRQQQDKAIWGHVLVIPASFQGSGASPEPTGWQGTIPGTGKGCQPQTHKAQCPAPRQGKIS